MHRLSSIILVLVGCVQAVAQSPHGTSLKIDCAACHNPDAWKPLRQTLQFNHNETDFALEGIHQVTDCKACHTSLVFEDAPSQCFSCHTDIHNMTVGNDCARCHTPQNWMVDNIPELHEQSGFPLIGAHSVVACTECHISETNLRFNPIGNDCVNCHRDDYETTTNPNHSDVGYSTNCIECHDPLSIGWQAELVNHDFFPLVQGHDTHDCKLCHQTANYADASPECVSCHMDDYSATKNPNHTEVNFSTQCEQCHTIAGWIPAAFDHDAFYPLLGAHKAIENNCIQCHANGYENTPNTCVGCHQDDYNQTTNPNHVSAQFSTDCKLCHTENAWEPAEFDHDGMYFPIYSGKHKDKWNLCTECHTSASNYAVFSCINCHEHSNKAEVDDDHKEVNGYTYTSTSCLSCHPNGD